MKKLKFFLRFDKEEKWLEQMAADGWLLQNKFICYEFRRTVPQKSKIRIDFRDAASKTDFIDYCTLFEDSGWKHLAGTKSSGTQYFLKMNDAHTADIFSDTLSRAERYRRLSFLWLSCAIIFLSLLLSMKTNGWIDPAALSAPKTWYLTPGLWKLDGFSFWLSFLFETPFALMRGIGWLLPAAAILICVFFTIKSRLLYRSETRDNP